MNIDFTNAIIIDLDDCAICRELCDTDPQPPCTDCLVIPPAVGPAGPFWKVNASSYDQVTGDWSVEGEVISGVNAGEAVNSVIDNGAPTCPANPVITSCVGCGGSLPIGTIVTYTGTSTPPSGASCCDGIPLDWGFGIPGGAIVFFSPQFVADPCP